jgi:hypothetical protein
MGDRLDKRGLLAFCGPTLGLDEVEVTRRVACGLTQTLI